MEDVLVTKAAELLALLSTVNDRLLALLALVVVSSYWVATETRLVRLMEEGITRAAVNDTSLRLFFFATVTISELVRDMPRRCESAI
jgi:hypothetical protein